jgi:hypothetical protein
MSAATASSRDVLRVLSQERVPILGSALASMRRIPSRYASAGQDETRRRLAALYDEMVEAVSSRDLGGIVDHARGLAAERFRSGYDLSEVQGAFNALEEAAWTTLCACVQAEELALSLALVTTVLGAAKDALAREYVSLASGGRVPSLDMRALFSGAAAAG